MERRATGVGMTLFSLRLSGLTTRRPGMFQSDQPPGRKRESALRAQ